MTHLRHYRIAAADYCSPIGNITAAQGHHWTEQAERDLRCRLGAGERPGAVLVAPERATAETVDPGGRIPHPVHAWEQESDWMHLWMHAPHVIAEMSSSMARRDQISEEYADHGSVQLIDPRIVRLHLSSWLAPIAEAIADALGVAVRVLDAPDVAAPEVEPADAVIIGPVMTPKDCEAVYDYYFGQDWASARGLVPEAGPSVTPPQELAQLMGDLLKEVGSSVFGLPVSNVDVALVCYGRGHYFPPHTDAGERLSKSLDRTVSATLMLADPGRDFTGGEFWINDKQVDLEQGSLTMFTARTWHHVEEITSGHRLVLVAFGEVSR